ncbi:HupE/UreJ family protein [Synechococcus sp. 1G10]|uniref:HupE/UreJ family protein n=1 Tax=Synechococcus sp. 1G10 TaxID=2025605 RepID=UPI000B988E8D|nr:HupE/UreJ family protein [Synechococcus sp. 1G10]
MSRFPSSSTMALYSGLAAVAFALAGQPAQAHGLAYGGIGSGFLHPLAGLDHLLLLIGVGAASAAMSSTLLVWALAGAVAGGVFGAMGGSLPFGELLAALAITAVAGSILWAETKGYGSRLSLWGGLVAAAVAVHAMLHGLEAPSDQTSLSWWLGALAGSVLVSGTTLLVLRRLPRSVTTRLAQVLAIGGGLVAFAPLALLLR